MADAQSPPAPINSRTLCAFMAQLKSGAVLCLYYGTHVPRFLLMNCKGWSLSLSVLLGVSSFSVRDVQAAGQSRCSVEGVMTLADGTQFLDFSEAQPFLLGSPNAACTAALDGLRQGLSLTSDQAGLRLCLVDESSSGVCVDEVARLKQGVDANHVLSLLAGQSAETNPMEMSAHLYVRPKAGL